MGFGMYRTLSDDILADCFLWRMPSILFVFYVM